MAARVLIDGIEYAPVSQESANIGIGVTTHDRPEVLAKTLEHIRRHTPGAKVVIVDDASAKPVECADHRYTENVGIARAKNKCLELLRDCEHIFLFDDDCWPTADGWHRPYVESPEPHLMYIFADFAGKPTLNDTAILHDDGQHVAYSHPRGCMLYFERRVLDTVGGMDPSFGRWGFEHGDLSNRIHAAGLTTYRYADVVGSSDLIHSMDEHRDPGHVSTVQRRERQTAVKDNQALHDERWDEALYCEYREMRDVVLTSYLTCAKDPQRDANWKPDPKALDPLRASVPALVVFADAIEADGVVKVEAAVNPYFDRWRHVYQYLRDHDDVRFAFAVDATDVVMLSDPFPHLRPGVLYCGSEPKTLGIPWMLNNHAPLRDWIQANASRTLLNAGLVGGDRHTLMRVAHGIIREEMNARIRGQQMSFDMGAFNHVAYTGGYEIVTGPMVHSLFRANETDALSWFRHK